MAAKRISFFKALEKVAYGSESRHLAQPWREEWSTDPRSDDFHYPIAVDAQGRVVGVNGNRTLAPDLTVRDYMEKDWEVHLVA